MGPDDFNRYDYFLLAACTGGFGFQANEDEQVLLGASLHIFVGSKRTRDQRLSLAA